MSGPRDSDWPEEPDRWEAEDRRWHAKWNNDEAASPDADPPEASGAPPGAGYVPRKASLGSVRDGYEEGMREAGPYLTIGLQIAFSMLFFVGGGWALDEWLGTSPWGVLAGTALGFVGVIGLVVRLAAEADAAKERRGRR